ncbi:MAG: hypothetical protein C0415_02875 [Thermodesulfovibrio sp.]|nr:hypothetical protein [Thermodesulfovibrio sp.]
MKVKISKYRAIAVVLCCIILTVGLIIVACVPEYSYKSLPTILSSYAFTGFAIPEVRPPGSVNLTVAVVEPHYKERVGTEYSNVIKSFSSSVGAGLDQMLVAKGFTTKGPYGSLDEVPFPDKKASNLTLTQTVFMLVTDKGLINKTYEHFSSGSDIPIYADVETRKLSLEAWIAFEMREPMSAEKMWIKKLDLGVFEEEYQIATQRHFHQPDPWAPPIYRTGKVLFDTRADVFAGILSKLYPKVMQAAWTYLHAEEMRNLDEKGREIRHLKRY